MKQNNARYERKQKEISVFKQRRHSVIQATHIHAFQLTPIRIKIDIKQKVKYNNNVFFTITYTAIK